jgi:hypothetical protein
VEETLVRLISSEVEEEEEVEEWAILTRCGLGLVVVG